MNEEIITKLDEEIKSQLDALSSLETGSKEHSEAVDSIVKLYKLRIEDSKAAIEYNKEIDEDQFRKDQMEQNERFRRDQLEQEKELRTAQMEQEDRHQNDQSEREEESRREQLKEQRIDRYVRIGIAAAELMVPIAFYGIWMRRGLKFEETGSFTSTTFKGLFNHFRPTRK